MTTKIEELDQKRKKNRLGFLIWSITFFTAWFIRSALKIFEVDNDLFYILLMIVLLLSIAFQVLFAIKDRKVNTNIKNDPLLKEALNDELVQLNSLKAWKIAFFATIGFVVFSAILWLLIDINDMMLIFLTTLLVGFGAYNISVYTLNR